MRLDKHEKYNIVHKASSDNKFVELLFPVIVVSIIVAVAVLIGVVSFVQYVQSPPFPSPPPPPPLPTVLKDLFAR